MAGHYPLKKQDEPTLFKVVEAVKNDIVNAIANVQDFGTNTVCYKGKFLTIKKLSKDYVENANNEVAVMVGKVNLKSITDEDKSLTHQINVEVHLIVNENKTEIKNIFWVV